MRHRLREWSAQPPTWKDFALALGGLGVATVVAVIGFGWWVDSQFDAGRDDDAKTRQRVDRIDDRVVRIERVRPKLCRRSVPCRARLRAETKRRRSAERHREQPRPRRDRRENDLGPDQRADRPPRAPVLPAPDVDDGDPPPDPPDETASTPTPQTPSPSPRPDSSIVEVDPPPVDVDGPDGLLPDLLPRVNAPPVDLPPIRLP